MVKSYIPKFLALYAAFVCILPFLSNFVQAEDTSDYIKVTNDRYRLGYHVLAPAGWINDPNGFSYFQGYYHIFYQYHPESAEWGPMHWGHARSKDLVHWETLPIALYPGDKEDSQGCFSGSAIVKDDTLYLIYTGNNYNETDPDNFWQIQNLAYSTDGINFTKYENNPIIGSPPEDNTNNFRDPQVREENGVYYLTVGGQTTDGLGQVLGYESTDLINWEYKGPIARAQNVTDEGSMWECPNLFSLNNKDILITSPQGIAHQEKLYLNEDQDVYLVGNLNADKTTFNRGGLAQVDQGHEFYAAQVKEMPDGRRVLIAWMDMWGSGMPEQVDGWAGALTLPRELVLDNDQLYMKPVAELETLRTQTLGEDKFTLESATLVSDKSSYVEINLEHEFKQGDEITTSFELKDASDKLLVSLKYDTTTNEFVLYRADRDDSRYATIAAPADKKVNLQVFVDKSSLEIFINDGEAVFTERYYTEDVPRVYVDASSSVSTTYTVYELNGKAITF